MIRFTCKSACMGIWARVLFTSVLLLSSCGGDGGGGEPSGITLIVKVAGDEQEGRVAQALADPLQVLVSENNAPLAGATVTWSTTAGTLTPASAPTDANGLVAAAWTLGPNSGLHTVTATVNGATTASVNFTATALPDLPAMMQKVVGDNQTGMINTVLGHIQVRVTDQFENPIPGVEVTWSASGATVTAATNFTGPAGISTAQVTLGDTPGPVTITAAVDGLDNSPLIFHATAEAIPPQS
jgi:hypothetical protein